MPSSFSTDLKLELMVTGENAGTWGDKTNTNLNLIQQAIAGYQGVSIAGGAQTTALVMSNAALSNARNMVIEFTGAITGDQIVTIPNGIEKYYILKNSTSGAFTVTFKYASAGSGIALTQGFLTAAYGDGSEIYKVDLTTLQGTIATAQIANLAVTSAKLASFAVTTARLASLAVTSNRLATNAVTTAKLNSLAVTSSRIASFAVTTARIASLAVTSTRLATFGVTTAKLNTAAVTATRLANTTVTAGTYTSATITVDAQGRITSASSGSAGAGMAIPNLTVSGPATGTYTATPSANRLGIYLFAGGGGQSMSCFAFSGAPGGVGGYGFYNKPITQPFSQPYSIGAGGNQNPSPGSGNAGTATTMTNVGTVNGGAGGNAGSNNGPGNAGSPGTAPGASFVPTFPSFVVGVKGLQPSTTVQMHGGSTQPGFIGIFENTGT